MVVRAALSKTSRILKGEDMLTERVSKCEKEWKALLREIESCKVWKALQGSIHESDIGDCPFMDKTGSLIYHRGTGAFSFEHVYVDPPATFELPYSAVRFCFKVYCWNDEWDKEKEEYCLVDVPSELVDNFDQEKYNKWLYEKLVVHRSKQKERAKKELMRILEEFPDLSEEIKAI